MANKEVKNLKQLQLEELRSYYGVSEGDGSTKNTKPVNYKTENNRKIAELYEDAAEYKIELARFEKELKLINAYELKNIVAALMQKFPDYEGNYGQEMQAIVVAHWTQLCEVKNSHPIEQLELLKVTEFDSMVEKFSNAFSDYKGDFESEIKESIVKRWEMLVEIKKQHIKEELNGIKVSGLKPDYAERIYNRYHGLEEGN